MKKKDRQLFETLVKWFDQDTMCLSSVESNHPYFKTTVYWGKARPDDIIPALLGVLDQNWHWSLALFLIVGKQEAPHILEEHAGHTAYIRQAWLDWGRANGYL